MGCLPISLSLSLSPSLLGRARMMQEPPRWKTFFRYRKTGSDCAGGKVTMRYVKETFLGSFNLQSNTTFHNQTLRYNAYVIARLLSFDVKSSNKFFASKIARLCFIRAHLAALVSRWNGQPRVNTLPTARARAEISALYASANARWPLFYLKSHLAVIYVLA